MGAGGEEDLGSCAGRRHRESRGKDEGNDQDSRTRHEGMIAEMRRVLGRFAFALLVAGATYNPTAYSFYTWAKSTGWAWRPPLVFVGVVLLIGWVICLRLTLRSIGGIALLLANAFLAALFWLFADWGWLPIDDVAAISWIGLVSVAAILAVGMSWSELRRSRSTPSR
jgi:uncharacterized protein DUF6524